MHHLHVYIGTTQPYAGSKPSAIIKRAVIGSILLSPLGLAGDEQAEKKVHGGPDRALCHFPREHYALLQQQFPDQAELFQAPALGENISTVGLSEQDVFIGDIFRWGEALIQITQPRSPCYKLNYHLKIKDISQLIQQSGHCGWLYRVIAPGRVSSEHPLELLSRNSDISVAEAIAIAFNMPFDAEQYRRLMTAAGLSASWNKTMQMRLINHRIENFGPRLIGAVHTES